MSDQLSSNTTQEKRPVFRRILVQRVLLGLLLIALIPIVVISAVNFIRTRNTMQTQAIDQLSSLANSYSQQIEQYINTRKLALDQINLSSGFDSNVAVIYQGKSASSYQYALTTVIDYFNKYIQSPTEKIFDQVSIVDSAGLVLVSSNRNLIGTSLTDSNFIKALYQTNQSVLAYDPGGLFPNQLELVTTKIYKNPSGAPGLTLIGFSTSSLPLSLLNTSQSFFDSSLGFLITADNKMITADQTTGLPILNEMPSGALDQYKTRLETSGTGLDYRYANSSGTNVFGYYKKLPFVNSNLIIEVPQTVILGQVQSLLPFTFILLAVLMLLSGTIVYFASRSMITPLTDLARNAQTFAAGDWSYRAKVDRDDEIGLLAFSFNSMVEQLTGYYRSLEEKVESRTHQLRLVSDIAQTAGSGLTQNDILHQTSTLISEKLDFPYHAIYAVDSLAKTARLIEQGSKKTGELPEINTTIPIDSGSMIGWSAANKQSRLSGDIKQETNLTNIQGLVDSTTSQLTVPIILENAVVAVLDFQSPNSNEFDNESSTVLSALAAQLSTGLRNVQAVESAQVGLREANALYTTSRQVTVSHSITDVENSISDLFRQTDYVSFFFSSLGDQIHLINVTDPKGTRLDQSLKGFNIPLEKGMLRLASSGPFILNDLKSASEFNNLSAYFEKRGCTSIALLPISFSNKIEYLLALGSREPSPISMAQMQPYINLTEVIGASLERVSLLTNLNQRVKELNTLSSISQSATTASDMEELYERLHQQLNLAFNEDLGFSVVLNNENEKTISIAYYKDKEKLSIPGYPYTDDLVSTLLVQGNPILHKDASALGLRSINVGEIALTAKSWLGIPLIVGRSILGGIILFDSETTNRFTKEDIDLLNTVAPQIAASIRNTELLDSQDKALKAFEGERFLLNSLLKNIPDEIVFKNPEGQFIRMSDSASHNLGIDDPQSLVGKPDPKMHETENDIDSDQVVLSTSVPVLGKIDEVAKNDGTRGWTLTTKIPLISDSGEVSVLLRISRDVTELVNTQNVAKRRADQLMTTSEIAREATTGNLDINETLKRLVELIKTRFGFYHSSIFLLDALGQFAVLRESTGEAGTQLKQSGHKLAVGSASIVGQATSKGDPVVVGDVTKEPNYYPNPLLPDTRSELGIPLKIGGKVYGALDVQSVEINAFTTEDISILRVLADQLTVTIQNADLYTKTQQTLERHRLLQQVTISSGQNITVEDAIRNSVQTLQRILPNVKISYLAPTSTETLKVNSFAGYSMNDLPVDEVKLGQGFIGKAGSEKRAQNSIDVPVGIEGNQLFTDSRSLLAVPVVYSNRLLGVFDIESVETGAFDENDQEIVSTLSSNLASLISNIQLVDQIRLQVERQRQLYDITSKIRHSSDIETIMKTSLAEICGALNIRKASIELLQNQEQIAEDSGISTSKKGY